MLPGIHPITLTRSEFAAVRAYVQGMPAPMVVGRYLSDDGEDDNSGESALRVLLGLRDRMVQLAHLHGRQDLAELLVAGPGRSNRGMDRRVDALAELERLGTAAPRPAHGVELWFGPALARRLRHGEIITLKALIERVNRRGTGWWRGVPRIGALAGNAINRWLGEHRQAIRDGDGQPLLAQHVGNREPLVRGVLAPAMARLLPLELMAAGADAPPDCPFAAGVEVVRRWLQDSGTAGSATYAAYRKEAERLLLWAAIERRKGLAALGVEDRRAYLAFLAAPLPVSRWCGPRAPRHQAAWRPFTGPLGEASIRHSMRVLAALWSWMGRSGYPVAARWEPLSAGGGAGSRSMSGAAGPAALEDVTVLPVPTAAYDSMVADEPVMPPDALPEPRRRDRASLGPFIEWLDIQARHPGGLRYRAAAAALALMRELQPGLAELVDLRATHLAPASDPTDPTEASQHGRRRCLSDTALAALRQHWHDRGLALDSALSGDAGLQAVPLLGPPRSPPTRRARRKRDASPHPPYSVRGLHALLSAAIARYRAQQDENFAVRSPRDLMG
ncbi:phage integrase family protein [Cupriavidus necator]|uniref:phage integrase family protein n=1 Tax=Cupriavidus necator TaxID=106590 RepID=UPI00339D4D7E